MIHRSDEIVRALSVFVDGEAEPDDLALLESALREDPSLARELAELLALDSLLRQQAEMDAEGFTEALRFRLGQAEGTDSGFENGVLRALAQESAVPAQGGGSTFSSIPASLPSASDKPGRSWLRPNWRRTRAVAAASLLAAAAVVMAGFFLFKYGGPSGSPMPAPAPVTWLARATLGVGARFAIDPEPPGGEEFHAGVYELSQGEILLTFRNGVQVTVRGPAKWELHDLTRMTVSRGTVRVTVPENARGFTVRSGDMDFQDLGTEFGVRADDAGGGSVMQVFSGAVDVLHVGSREKLASLTSGQAYGTHRGSEAGPAAMLPMSSFPDPQNLALRSWEESSRGWAADDSMLAYFPLWPNQARTGTLTSASSGKATETEAEAGKTGSPKLEATVSGCQWVTGRWPGKPALQFENPGDALRFNLPGEYTDLTACFWLKLDRIIHPWTQFWGSAELKDDSLQFCLRSPYRHFSAQAITGKGTKTVSVNMVRPFGTWMLVTLVLDSRTHESRLYIDGQRSSCYTWNRPDWRFRPGAMTIGRCDDASAPDPREFRGRLDEFALWGRVLSDEEIGRFFRSGQPAPP